MVLAGVLIALLCFYAALLFVRGHYLFAIFIGLFSFYEFSSPIMFLVADNDPRLIGAVSAFLDHATGEAVLSLTGAALVFLALASSSYFASARLFPVHSREAGPIADSRLSDFFVLILAVFVFGVISAFQQAGSTRLLDYLGEEELVAPFYFYGGTLLVTVVALILYSLRSSRWGWTIVLLIAVAPLAHEFFISSRRQHFAPAILLILVCLLYSREIRHKALSLITISAAVLVAFGLQFWMRFQFTAGLAPGDIYEAVLMPQLVEFAAIGLTSFESWGRFVLENQDVTYGAHWLFHALDSVPYLKLGSLLFPAYEAWLTGFYRELSPWGGLSMLADSLLGAGITGLVAFAIVSGMCLWWWHTLLLRYLPRGLKLSIGGVYAVSMIVTLVPMYRSGLGGAIQGFVSLSVLYFFFVVIGVAFMSQLRLVGKASPGRIGAAA